MRAASNAPGRYEAAQQRSAPIKSFTGEACQLGFILLRKIPTGEAA